jgi:hypothetical protein
MRKDLEISFRVTLKALHVDRLHQDAVGRDGWNTMMDGVPTAV